MYLLPFFTSLFVMFHHCVGLFLFISSWTGDWKLNLDLDFFYGINKKNVVHLTLTERIQMFHTNKSIAHRHKACIRSRGQRFKSPTSRVVKRRIQMLHPRSVLLSQDSKKLRKCFYMVKSTF